MSFFSQHSVFHQAASNFVHSVSSSALSNLIASPSLADASNCRPYHLVIKKNKKYFWNPVSLFPTSFTLSDILDDDRAEMFDEVGSTTAVLVNFERSLRIKINLKKDFIKEVTSKKRNTLCLVVATLSPEADSKITTKVKTHGSADVKVPIEPVETIGIDASAEINRRRTLEIPSDTPLAFRMLEILVRPDRSIQLMQLPNSEGGFRNIKDDNKTKPGRERQSSIETFYSILAENSNDCCDEEPTSSNESPVSNRAPAESRPASVAPQTPLSPAYAPAASERTSNADSAPFTNGMELAAMASPEN
eukprot:XP_011666134.1 PREDICTED: uncharacterized protein LOC105439155 [Strongylocentrotus purpuratus]